MIFGFPVRRIKARFNKKINGIPQTKTQVKNIKRPSTPKPKNDRVKGISEVKKSPPTVPPIISPIKLKKEMKTKIIPKKKAIVLKAIGMIFKKKLTIDFEAF